MVFGFEKENNPFCILNIPLLKGVSDTPPTGIAAGPAVCMWLAT
jgi:hypothetical protein